jgi:hypothetical protein
MMLSTWVHVDSCGLAALLLLTGGCEEIWVHRAVLVGEVAQKVIVKSAEACEKEDA